MTNTLRIDLSNSIPAIPQEEWDAARKRIQEAQRILMQGDGPGNDFLGWKELPRNARSLLPDITETAARIRENSDALIVVGIGGSYLGARAVIEALRPPFAGGPEVHYAGQHIDGAWLRALMLHLDDKRVSINVISKSGTTTEPALAFRVLRQWMERRYGREGASQRIIATTDAARGALRGLADAEGYKTYVIPDDVGGRFSVLTPVGLLPIAAAGLDIAGLLDGAEAMLERSMSDDPAINSALSYAAVRDALYRSGKRVEVLASFVPAFSGITEWWKQLFGESEGKNGKGIFPAAVNNTTDLHSLGQYIQDGERMLFETFLVADAVDGDIAVPTTDEDADGMGFVAGKSFLDVNRNAHLGTALAHSEGGVPNSTIHLMDTGAASIGALLYMFETAVAYGGYALGVNPFDQPGVEDYKRNMFALLGKPGYEDLRARLLSHNNAR
ncbi:MAG: glucose-6-phosphate isomerase [Bacteroidia bacterium]|nr:glucose-6-phosphate isomerase [Bacteroidia bacterium]